MQEIWFAHVLRYSRRDQLSVNLAFHRARLKPLAIEIDNYKSWFHSWPHDSGRDRKRGMRDVERSLAPTAFRLRQLEQALEENERGARDRVAQEKASAEALKQALDAAEIRVADAERRVADYSGAWIEAAIAKKKTEAELVEAKARLEDAILREARLLERCETLQERSIPRLPHWLFRSICRA